MYILERRSLYEKLWEDVTKSDDYDFILELCRLSNDKYDDFIYRVVEVYYSV